jgi:hypothetical protein
MHDFPRPRHYILNGHEVVPAVNVAVWAQWIAIESMARTVAKTDTSGCTVSTVFLGLDHRFSGEGPPVLFETLIFGGKHDGEMWRCCTWDEAEAQHARVVASMEGK